VIKLERFYIRQVIMRIGNSETIDGRDRETTNSEYSYSPSLDAALKLILRDPAFVDERETPSFKFIRAARFLKVNAPHSFQIREMGVEIKSGMDCWLWDLAPAVFSDLPSAINLVPHCILCRSFIAAGSRPNAYGSG
jgi:hypothetical protein